MIRRLLWTIVVMVGAVTIVFIVMRFAGGDPTYTILGDHASPEVQEALREKLGLNRPIYQQYFDYTTKLFTFNFGNSLVKKVPIGELVLYNIRFTMELAILGFVIAMIIGIPMGIIAAYKRNSGVDHVIRIVSLIFPSMPPFYVGIVFILLFTIIFPMFPSSGGGNLNDFSDRMYRLILPALSLGLFISGILCRITRASMLDTINKDYVTVARSKGLDQIRTILKHVFRNALIPIVTTAGMLLAAILAGTVMTEMVFGRPGLGKLLVISVNSRDYPVVETLLALYALIIAFSNLLVDIIYAYLDPRIRYE